MDESLDHMFLHCHYVGEIWERVCRPKNEGGMGLINMQLWNRAAIAKLCWDLANKEDKLWIKWIHCNDLFSRFEQQILFLKKQAEATDPTTDRRGHDGSSQGLVPKHL